MALFQLLMFFTWKNELLIERFLCLLEDSEDDDENGWYDIEVVLSDIDTRLTDDEDLTGINVIPFAVLFAGDFLCLDFREKKYHLLWYGIMKSQKS